MAMAQNYDVSATDDFFGANNNAQNNTLRNPTNTATNQNIRQSFNLKRGAKIGSRLDFNYFDSKLIDRAIGLL
jgi:hypothetical protein